jgi:lysophospholipid acyltransferase (LPLAT)-like uncharacterized protein
MSETPLPRELSSGIRYRLVGVLGAALLTVWGATLNVDWIDVRGGRRSGPEAGPRLFAFWHRGILPLTYLYRHTGSVVLISRHSDGEYISHVTCRLGFGVVRGSTSRGGLRALLEMARAGRLGHRLAVSPDGPRGPRRVLQTGLLHIAQRSALPISPVAFEAVRRTELPSWDRFVIPHPWSRVVVVAGDPIRIPPDASPDEIEEIWAPTVSAAMEACDACADRWRAERIGS